MSLQGLQSPRSMAEGEEPKITGRRFELETPVAFIVFNRPRATERVFAAIAEVKPPKLLVVGDGARANRAGEAENVAAVRAVVERVDWDCEVLMNFSAANLGCRRRESSGLDWVFEQVDEAIVLEDDCLPDLTFFRFCQEMLTRYRDDKRIGMISCANFRGGRNRRDDNSYYFSKYSIIWGWASWSDRWKSYDVEMRQWSAIRADNRLEHWVGSSKEGRYWRKVLERVYRGEIDTWDYQWFLANWLEGRLAVVPTVNLISNIGYGDDATHTRDPASTLANLPTSPMAFPLRHPPTVSGDAEEDRHTYAVCFRNSSGRRWRRKLRAYLRRLFGNQRIPSPLKT